MSGIPYSFREGDNIRFDESQIRKMCSEIKSSLNYSINIGSIVILRSLSNKGYWPIIDAAVNGRDDYSQLLKLGLFKADVRVIGSEMRVINGKERSAYIGEYFLKSTGKYDSKPLISGREIVLNPYTIERFINFNSEARTNGIRKLFHHKQEEYDVSLQQCSDVLHNYYDNAVKSCYETVHDQMEKGIKAYSLPQCPQWLKEISSMTES